MKPCQQTTSELMGMTKAQPSHFSSKTRQRLISRGLQTVAMDKYLKKTIVSTPNTTNYNSLTLNLGDFAYVKCVI
jgi:hypothetical protein